MARVPADATAYAHRASRIMVNVAAFYDGADDKPAQEAWVDEFAGGAATRATPARTSTSSATRARRGSARPTRARRGIGWRAIKAQYDPDNLFRLQPEHPAGAGRLTRPRRSC